MESFAEKGEEEKDDNYLPLSTQRGKREQDRKGTSITGWDYTASATCSELWTKRCNWHLKAHGRRRWNQVIWCLHFWFQQVKEYCFSVHRKTFQVQTAWCIRMYITGKCWLLSECTVQTWVCKARTVEGGAWRYIQGRDGRWVKLIATPTQ